MDDNTPVVTTISHHATQHAALGREIRISPRAHVQIGQPGAHLKFPEAESVYLHFGIGTDHVGYLMMTRQAWEALKGVNKISITNLSDYRKSVFPKTNP